MGLCGTNQLCSARYPCLDDQPITLRMAKDQQLPMNPGAHRQARHAITGLRRFARFNLGARPRVALFDGQGHRIDGDLAAARRSWERARTTAARLDMPYEAALADIELAASHRPGSAERTAAAERALANLEPNGASFDAARARDLLDAPSGSGAGQGSSHAGAGDSPVEEERLSDEEAGVAAG